MDSRFTTVDVALPGGRRVALVLPAESEDPIVAEYRSGLVPNAYLTELLLKLTSPGERVVDLGAHLGTLSVPAAALGREVLAVDAAELHVDALREAARHNRLEALHVMHCAVGDEEGWVEFIDAGLWGRVELGGDSRARRVRCRRVDAILDELGWDSVALVKLDIEGSELRALRSCEALLRTRPPALVYESNPETFETFGYSAPEMRRYLESIGYRTYRHEGGRFFYCAPDELQPELWVDLVALDAARQATFAEDLRPHWPQADLVARCLLWGGLPYPNVRRYLRRELASRPDLVARIPELQKLRERLSREE
jgi:FkbM family methyltransferase